MPRVNANEIKAQEAALAAELAKTEGNNPPALRRMGAALYPDGFTDAAIGSLDKTAALAGDVKPTNGDQFDRQKLVDEIMAKVDVLSDLELMELHSKVSTSPATPEAPAPVDGVVDTSVLTGDRGGLKNFLIKKGRDEELQS